MPLIILSNCEPCIFREFANVLDVFSLFVYTGKHIAVARIWLSSVSTTERI